MKRVFAIMVNPRDAVPYFAIVEGPVVEVFSLVQTGRWGMEAIGAIDSNATECSVKYGLPQVHTEVFGSHGTGLGTVLYASLAVLVAQQRKRQWKDVFIGKARSDGISSTVVTAAGQRSRAAERWWADAVDRFGIAESLDDCYTLRTKDVIDRGLCVAVEDTKRLVRLDNAAPEDFRVINPMVLAALDTGEMLRLAATNAPRGTTVKQLEAASLDALRLLAGLAKRAGLSKEDRDPLYDRFAEAARGRFARQNPTRDPIADRRRRLGWEAWAPRRLR